MRSERRRRHASWQPLASLQQRPCKQHKHVLQAGLSMQTRPPVSLDHLRAAFTHTHTHAAGATGRWTDTLEVTAEQQKAGRTEGKVGRTGQTANLDPAGGVLVLPKPRISLAWICCTSLRLPQRLQPPAGLIDQRCRGRGSGSGDESPTCRSQESRACCSRSHAAGVAATSTPAAAAAARS